MILLLAIIAGLLAGLGRAWMGRGRLASPHLCLAWLVPLAFIPQGLAFYLPATREWLADDLVALGLVSSQLLLLLFAWLNRRQPGFWALGLGLALNLLVISLNGGLMPISPETVAQLNLDAPPGTWQIGSRAGTSKDIVLPIAATRLWWLSDRFLLPAWSPYRVAFSIGDVFIAGGAFWLLWALGGTKQKQDKEQERQGTRDEPNITNSPERFANARTEPVDNRSSGEPGVLQSAANRPHDSADNRL